MNNHRNHHPALLYDPRNRVSFPSWEEVVPGVSYAVIQTRDWRIRGRYIEEEVSSAEDFIKGLESRCSFFLAQFPVPDTLDVHHARSLNEKRYAERLADVDMNPFPGRSRVEPEMLLLSPQQLGIDSDGNIKWWSDSADRYKVNFRPSRQLRGEERRHRHRLEVFVSFQDKEAGALFPRVAGNRYPKLPSWWAEYEVPYGFRAMTPPLLTYRGVEFMSRHSYGWDLMLRTEWATMCAVELYSEALQGFLWWLPPAVMNDIERLGVEYIFDTASSGVINDIRSLLHEVKCIRWDRVSVVNRFLPRFAHEPTPTYESGDFVEFNVDNWRTELDNSMYLPLDSHNQPIGVSDRGQRISGPTEGLPSYSNPHGRQPGLDEQGREPGYRLAERHGVSKTRWASARGILRSLAEQHGVFGLLQDLGHRGPFDPKTFMEHYRELLLEQVAQRRLAEQQETGENNTPQLIATAQRISTGRLLTRFGSPQDNAEPDEPQGIESPEHNSGQLVSRRLPMTPVVDLTSPPRVSEDAVPPRHITPAGSSSAHATIGQQRAAMDQSSNFGSQGDVILASGRVSSRPQADMNTIREGVRPSTSSSQDPRWNWSGDTFLIRRVPTSGGPSSSPFQVNEGMAFQIQPAFVAQRSTRSPHDVPVITEQVGASHEDVEMVSAPRVAASSNPVTAALDAVEEARRAADLDSANNSTNSNSC